MGELKDKITVFIEENIDNEKFYLVAFEDHGQNNFDAFIESYSKEDSFNLEKVIEISRKVNEEFDRDIEDFQLSISSAGLDLAFRDIRQYKKYLNDKVDILLKTGIKLKEVDLVTVEDEYIEVAYQVKEKLEGQKKKTLVDKKDKIEYSNIKETKITVFYK
jgi:ribosome maturation factor RimP